MLNKWIWTWTVKDKSGETHVVELNNRAGKHEVFLDEVLIGHIEKPKFACLNYEYTFQIDDETSCSIVALATVGQGKQPLFAVNGKFEDANKLGIPKKYVSLPKKDNMGFIQSIVNRIALFINAGMMLYFFSKGASLLTVFLPAFLTLILTSICDHLYKFPRVYPRLFPLVRAIFWIMALVGIFYVDIYFYQLVTSTVY